MKHLAFLALFLVCSINAQHTSWSWNEKDKTETLNLDNGDKLVMSTFDLEPSASEHDEQVAPNSEETKTSARSGRNLNIGEKSVEQSPRQGRILGPNPNSQDTLSNEAIIDEIIANFGAQSRSLEGYDEVYADPGVQEALQSADEAEARNVIRDRLCYLQLMKCDDEEINGKNPYIAPEELQYAQPVAINPVGRPIPTIPLKGGKGMYGPPRPAYSSGNKYGPPSKYPAPYSPNKPPRRNYGPPPSKPFYGPPGTINKPPFLSGGEILAEGEFLDKPPSAEYFNKIPGPLVSNSPYQFDQTSSQSAHHKDKRVEIHVNAQGGVASVTGAPLKSDKVEHVHHHYHHNADEVKQTPTVIVNPVPIAAAAVSSAVSSSNSYASSNGYGSNSGSLSFGSGLSGSSSNYASSTGLGSYESSGFKPTYETGFKPITENYGPQTFGNTYSSGLYGSNSNSFGATAGYYGNTGLYKKELNIDSGNSNYLEKYQGVESARAENYDCVCVPYDQCPVHDVIGKRDDLFLAIDPRNLKSDIEALPENETVEAVVTDSNGNMTVVRVPKETNKNETAEVKEEIKKISKREISAEPQSDDEQKVEGRQAYYSKPQTCGPRHVCCKRPFRPPVPQVNKAQCGTRHSQGINGRIKTPAYVDGDSEFGEYPWQAAILRKDPKESVYVCGGTLIDPLHIITAAHCVKQYTSFDLRVRLGEWDVNHDVEFYPYIERDVSVVTVHPEFYAGTLYNDLAILRMDKPVDWSKHPHISPACLPHPQDDYSGSRCWTTGWGKDAFGDFGKYQNILKEVDVPVIGFQQCQRQLQNTRLGYEFKLHPGFVCAGGEEGKDSCKGDGGGPMVCERGGTWQVVGVVSWGIGCGQRNVPGVYVRVAHYLDWIRQVTQRY